MTPPAAVAIRVSLATGSVAGDDGAGAPSACTLRRCGREGGPGRGRVVGLSSLGCY